VIGFLEGTVVLRRPEWCLIDVGGVGYKVSCSTTTMRSLPSEGRRARLFTYLYVREDALALYGFATESEQGLFEAALAVAGIGPKVALAICSAFTPEAFRHAVVAGDTGAIAAVPGIGKKTAQRMLLELKDKLDIDELAPEGPSALAQARFALENLGYSPAEVSDALAHIPHDSQKVEDVVRDALARLAATR
jgi:Holliday junction DNA helicase RuvA